jgi:hypothetical protein
MHSKNTFKLLETMKYNFENKHLVIVFNFIAINQNFALLFSTVKPVYNSLAYNGTPLLAIEFSKTDSINSIRFMSKS